METKIRKPRKIEPTRTEEGLKNTLKVLSKLQRRYPEDMNRYFTDKCVFLFTSRTLKDPMDAMHVYRYLSYAEGKGYLERGAVHEHTGRAERMIVGFRIKNDKLSEIEKIVGRK